MATWIIGAIIAVIIFFAVVRLAARIASIRQL